MRLTRLTGVAAAALAVSGVLTAAPAEAAACPAGFVCVYPQANFQGPASRYALRDLTGNYSAGHGLGTFTRIANARSAQNRIGFTVELATQAPKTCIRTPCPQYRTSELLRNGGGKAVMLEPHNIARRAV